MTSILVLDGHTLSALAIVRSLGRMGHKIIVAAAMNNSVAGQSRFSSVQLQLPVEVADAESYVKWIQVTCDEFNVERIFWTTTDSTLALDRYRAYLDASLISDLPSQEIVDSAYDKVRTVEIARQVGVPAPATWVFTSADQLSKEFKILPTECVIKPSRSSIFQNDRIINCGSHAFSRDEETLQNHYVDMCERGCQPMIQEFVPGYGFGLFLLMSEGNPVAAFAHRRIREANPQGSGSSFRISTEVPQDALDHSVSLLKAMKWNGVAMVEFRRDSRDGVARLIEINGRFWFSLTLAVRAGVDFPALLLRVKEGKKEWPELPNYQIGIGCHWIGGEIMHLYKVMRGKPAGYPATYPGRLATVARMIVDCITHPSFDSFQLNDPRPAVAEIRLLLKGII